jgi:hypothetical protein
MKKLVLAILIVFLFIGCKNHDDKYYNYKVIVKEKGGYAERNGKYTNVGKYFLVQSVEDTTLYTELNGYNFDALGEHYGSSLFYSKEVGDTLFFDYIKKDRFWEIEK